jgi:hypothetical protein
MIFLEKIVSMKFFLSGNGPALPFGRRFPSRRKFGPLEGNLEGNSIWKEIGRKYCNKEGNEKEIYFIS